MQLSINYYNWSTYKILHRHKNKSGTFFDPPCTMLAGQHKSLRTCLNIPEGFHGEDEYKRNSSSVDENTRPPSRMRTSSFVWSLSMATSESQPSSSSFMNTRQRCFRICLASSWRELYSSGWYLIRNLTNATSYHWHTESQHDTMWYCIVNVQSKTEGSNFSLLREI